MPTQRKNAIALCLCALVFQIVAVEMTLDALFKEQAPAGGLVLLLVSLAMLLLGGTAYVKAKGYHPVIGAMSVVPLLGLLAVIFLPDLSDRQSQAPGFEVLPSQPKSDRK